MNIETKERAFTAGPKGKSAQYIAKVIELDELHQAHSLRHKIFAEELKWVEESCLKLEFDRYETDSVSFGVFDQEHVLKASLRLVPSSRPYMLERDFPFLVRDGHQIRKSPDAAEITRLCVEMEARKTIIDYPFGENSISLLLYRSLYQWCRCHEVRYLYMVVERKVFRLLNRLGFPSEAIGDSVKMPDGVTAIAALLDWDAFDELHRHKNPLMHKWFLAEDVLSIQLFPPQSQMQLLETG